MNIILYRYSPRSVMLNKLVGEGNIVLVPSNQKSKFLSYKDEGYSLPEIKYIEDYTLVEIIRTIRNISNKKNIESITTLSEEDIDWAGLLHDHFVLGNSISFSNFVFKNKYYMRSFLIDIVKQPYFRLIHSIEDIKKFWKSTQFNKAIIKPISSSGSQGILKINRESQQYDKYLFNGNYMIEEFVDTSGMVTGDGYSIGKKIIRFFVHEYEDFLLNSLSESSDYCLRTSQYYWYKKSILENVLKESKKVLRIFTVKEELTPFHFEWFIDEKTGEVIFCEVGKRFGGANIPSLVKNSFGIDLLDEYWKNIGSKMNYQNYDIIQNSEQLILPQYISATYSPLRKRGKVISIPDKSKFDWTENTWIFVDEGDITNNSDSVVENLFLSEFKSKSEKEYAQKLSSLRGLKDEFVYGEIDD